MSYASKKKIYSACRYDYCYRDVITEEKFLEDYDSEDLKHLKDTGKFIGDYECFWYQKTPPSLW